MNSSERAARLRSVLKLFDGSELTEEQQDKLYKSAELYGFTISEIIHELKLRGIKCY